jgi:hypothetical protein
MWIHRALLSFIRTANGSVTVEALPWIGILGVTIALAADAAGAFQSMSYILRSVQDANRLVSIGAIRDPIEASDHVGRLVTSVFPDAQAVTVIDTVDGVVSTSVSIPWTSLHLVGILTNMSTDNVVITTAHALEWN